MTKFRTMCGKIEVENHGNGSLTIETDGAVVINDVELQSLINRATE